MIVLFAAMAAIMHGYKQRNKPRNFYKVLPSLLLDSYELISIYAKPLNYSHTKMLRADRVNLSAELPEQSLDRTPNLATQHTWTIQGKPSLSKTIRKQGKKESALVHLGFTVCP